MQFIRESVTVARRILTEHVRTRRTLVFWGLFPALMLLLFGTVYANMEGGLGQSFQRTAPGILIGAALFFSCLSGPVTLLVAERERHTLKRLLLTPLSGTGYFLGVVLTHLVIAGGQTVIVYGIAYGFGGRFVGSLGLGMLVLALTVATYVGLRVFPGACLARRTEDANGPVAAIGVPLLVLGGTFFPVSLLPPFLLTVAWFNPVFHMKVAFKGISNGGTGLDEIGINVLVLAACAAAAMAIGISSYRALLRKERNR